MDRIFVKVLAFLVGFLFSFFGIDCVRSSFTHKLVRSLWGVLIDCHSCWSFYNPIICQLNNTV